MYNLPMFTFQSKHYCQIIADGCGRQVEGVGIKSHEILGTSFTKYGTVIDTMALHKEIPASIKKRSTALPQHGYVGTAAPGHCGHLMGTCGQFRPTRHSKLGHYSDIIPRNYEFYFLENCLGVSPKIWGQEGPGHC